MTLAEKELLAEQLLAIIRKKPGEFFQVDRLSRRLAISEPTLDDIIQNIKKLDDTLKSFLGNLAKYGILGLALITVLQQFGVQTASLLAVLGAAGLAIGLALQGTLKLTLLPITYTRNIYF